MRRVSLGAGGIHTGQRRKKCSQKPEADRRSHTTTRVAGSIPKHGACPHQTTRPVDGDDGDSDPNVIVVDRDALLSNAARAHERRSREPNTVTWPTFWMIQRVARFWTS